MVLDAPGNGQRGLHLQILDVHRPHRQALVAEQALVGPGHVVLHQQDVVVDPGDLLGRVTAGEVAVADLPVVVLTHGVVALTDVAHYRHAAQAFQGQVDGVHRRHLGVAGDGEQRLVDLGMATWASSMSARLRPPASTSRSSASYQRGTL